MIAEGWYDRDVHPRLVQRRRCWCATTPAGCSPPPISTRAARPRTTWPGTAARPAPGGLRSGAPAVRRARRGSAAPRHRALRHARRRPGRLPARVRALRRALSRLPARARSARITGVPAAQIVATARLLWERRPGGLLPLDRARAAHQREPDRAGACRCSTRSPAAGTRPAATSGPRGPPTNDLAPLVAALRGPAREGARPRRAAARPRPRLGWATGVDAYRAILHGTPYPVRGMVGFGANLLLSQPDAGVARAALVATGLPRLRRSLPHADRRAGRRGPAGVHGVGARGPARGLRSHARGRAARAAPRARWWRRGARRARTPGSSASWPGAWASAIGFFGGDEDAGPRLHAGADRRDAEALRERARGRVACRSSCATGATPRPQGDGARSASPRRAGAWRSIAGALLEHRPGPAARLRRARDEPGEPARSRRALSAGAHHRQGRAVLPQPAPQPAAPAPAQPRSAGRAASLPRRRRGGSRRTTGW